MSSGTVAGEYPGEAPLVVHRAIGLLAPHMQAAVMSTIADCNSDGLDAMVYETYRDRTTAEAYYRRGRSQIPPAHVVTQAPNELYSWHGYCLAVDIISATHGWNVREEWFAHMGRIAKTHELKWGGDWTHPDTPHVQWGRCKATPSDEARRLFSIGGLNAVWDAVGAA